MNFFILFLCFFAIAYCQIIRPGNTAGEVGVPEFDEIKVESVLTVRSKSASRTGKSSDSPKSVQNNSEVIDGVNVSRNGKILEGRKVRRGIEGSTRGRVKLH